MVQRRTVDLLPEIFRTDTNRKFLSATLDQLTQETSAKRIQGFVGRRVGPGVDPADNYVTEPSAVRSDYQLEPGVVFFKPDTTTVEDAITYPGMIDALDLQGADTTRQDRLFQSQYYSWDPFCDLDKFSNYSQYYWLPAGPDSVDVGTSIVALTDDFEVTRDANAYVFSGVAGVNPPIVLVRGGNYQFEVSQTGHPFWIQAAPGINGRMPATPNISSRDVLGVINNGEDLGTVTFNVPLKTAQDFYYGLNDLGTVDLITDLKFNQINNVYVDAFLDQFPNGIDGITNLSGRTVIFTNTINDAQDGGWQVTTQFDPLAEEVDNNGLVGSYDTTLFDQTTDITNVSQRYSVWQIQYILDDQGQPFMRLSSILAVPNLSKLRVLFGTVYSSTSWYKNASGYFEQIPLLTAVLDTLWYQDGTNPEIFGQIKLLDPDQSQPLDINEIIGAKNYTSPNGVVFTNGLKVQFRGLTEPPEFQNLEYYVEGVGTGLGIDARVGFIDGEAYFGAFHVYQGQKMTGATHSDQVFQQFIYDTVEESLENLGAGAPVGAPPDNRSLPGAALGNGIRLLPVSDFVTPETYTESATVPYDSTPYDVGNYDSTLNAPEVPDYITINRASRDLNPWTRSNRWFHVDVIRYTAELNNQIANIDNLFRAKRPIIEFRANLDLYNFGTQGKLPVDIIDFSATDAFSNINGQLGYGIDGYTLINGSRVIFAADSDPQVRNRIYRVEFIDPDGQPGSPQIINLVAVPGGEALYDQTVVCLSGNTLQGQSFWFNGVDWVESQQKTGVNQAPLFDVVDANGYSLGDRAIYPSSTFVGSRLFGYALGGTQRSDEVLGFALKYLNINNVGDILFENYFYTDTFVYVRDSASNNVNISTGFVRQYLDRTAFSSLIGWLPAAAENRSRQVFRFVYNGDPLILDVPVDNSTPYPPLQIFLGSEFIDPDRYVVEIGEVSTIVTLLNPPEDGTVIEVQALSNVASGVAFYQVPLNLENNPLNENSGSFTLGTIRTHYESIGQNLRNISGPINGANNTRDLGNILIYGDNIVQHSSPLALPGVFLRQQQYEILSAMAFNSREYQKYKALLLDLAGKGDYVNNTPTQILDSVLEEIALGRDDVSPFYWSDMLPSGETYTEARYVYSPISTPTFDTLQTYDFNSSNYLGLLIYVNGTLLTLGYDYEVGENAPIVTITSPLAVGDVIIIREYAETYGSYVPNTPTKMGLYPAYRPQMYLDTTYVNPTMVIQGHDGSITVAFGDYRDQVLLEFETRIFDNLKINTPVPLTLDEVMPGQFRDTSFSLSEINEILSTDFLSWVGWNKLDYTTQTYLANNEFTYNYSQSSNKLTGEPLLGAWRGIYNYFYDTDTPGTTPWEMLGFSQAPDWWEQQYGPAPYTSGNLVLWDDLANGIVRDPNGSYVLPQFRRPGLLDVLPTGSEGGLLSPLESTVGNYDATSFRRSWTFGDDGPVENVWRTSSAWPFAVMRLLALTKPAKFFNLFADRDRYVFDDGIGQYLWNGRYRLDAKQLAPLYGNGTSRASYINWIIDYNRQLGVNSTTKLETTLANIGVRLCWRLAGFTDKKYLKIYTERSTPNSLNTSLLLPDESYQLLLYKDQPFERITYSSVIIQSTDTGWAIFGYSSTAPYFNILVSRPNGLTTTISAGGTVARVNLEYTDNVAQIPYGYVFTNTTAVCDFLLSYGRLLENQGWEFENKENGYVLDWQQMAQEFLYWSQQGWTTGSIINLNPAATRISVARPQAIVDSIASMTPENLILNQNRQPLPAADLVIDRIDNLFRVTSLTANTINYLDLKFTAYEHIVVLDNVSIFADLIYQPVTGARQSRVLVSGVLSSDWTGLVNAPGFVLNQDNIKPWNSNVKYAKGEIVLFKDEYWSASTIIQPSQEFNYSQWIKSDYDQIQKGLLSNAANDSDQLARAYSVYNANLEQEVDLFSYGLIGFRPREYMQALNLDDVSQVNLYQQFLGTKGTRRSAEIFSLADLGKETAQYDIYEYWAILRSTYGANANRSYIELLLNEAKLNSDPCLVQVIQPQQESEADQTILLQNVWKESYKLTSTDIFPTTTQVPTDIALPSAGYVNIDDVDFTAFSLDDTALLSANLENIGVGSTVWVAKSNSYDWNVYRCEPVPGDIFQVSDNLDGRSEVQFTQQHGLQVGDFLIIRFFDPSVDGVYRVRSVPSLQTVLIDFTFGGFQTVVTGLGVGFTLESVRVAQASDISQLPYSQELVPGARAWVDNNGSGLWTVLEKTEPFDASRVFSPLAPEENSHYGASLAQGFQNLTALVGAPRYNPDLDMLPPGGVYTYVKTDADVYEENSVLQLGTEDTAGYGNAIDIGNQNWAIVGASESLAGHGYAAVIYQEPSSSIFQQWQLLVRDDAATAADEFGYSVTMSQDENWIYVGAPGGNRVYAYARVDYQPQFVSYTTNGSTFIFNYDESIVINDDTQLAVVLGNAEQTLNVDYFLDSGNVIFYNIPAENLSLRMVRRTGITSTGTALSTLSVVPLYTAVDIHSFSVYKNDSLLRPEIDYLLNTGMEIVFTVPTQSTDTIQVRADTYYTPVFTVDPADFGITLDPAARFGHSVSTTVDGRQLIVGCPGDQSFSGSVYVFDRSVQRFEISDTALLTYTTQQNIQGPVFVTLNGQFLLNTQNNIGGEFTLSGNSVTLESSVTINVGDNLEIETNQLSFLQAIESVEPQEAAEFGYSVDQCVNNCSLYIGAPFDSYYLPEAGQVEFKINQARTYGIITSAPVTAPLTPGDFIRINNVFVECTGTTLASLADDINTSGVPNVTATVTNDQLTISVKNFDSAPALLKLQVLPGTGTLFEDLGFEIYVHQQIILSPVLQEFAHFGQSIFISDNTTTLIVGAPTATLIRPTTFDNNTTIFDARSTDFYSPQPNSGAVYTFDFLPSASPSVTNPGQFVFGQQIYDESVQPIDQFGTAVDYTTGVLLIGSPGKDLNDSSENQGSVLEFRNTELTPAWQILRLQRPVVNTALLNTVFMYDQISGQNKQYFDFFDPLQGKLLGAVRQNLDYIGAVDPAAYNNGEINNYGNKWTQERVGQIWWNTDRARFIDPNQDDIVYASRRWGQLFPDSSVDVYQWISSSVPPAQYTGPGRVFDTTRYVSTTALGSGGIFETVYYFWVSGIVTVDRPAKKTLSVQTIARYIESPRSSGISYIAPINSSTVAIYNGLQYISAQDTVLHVEFDRQATENAVHVEYQLIAQDRAQDFLNDMLYRKIQDSFCGVDSVGAQVPDPFLSPSDRYGVEFRPRQSMFVNRFLALENYLRQANTVLAQFPISESRRFDLLNSQEPIPPVSSGAWDSQVANLEELSYQDLAQVPLGYKYLVDSDSTNRGLWTIYEVVGGATFGSKTLALIRVQNYDTRQYWSYIDWYRPGYNPSVRVVAEVPTFSALDTISVPDGSSVKVTANAQGKFEIYQLTNGTWIRMALQDGTIRLSPQLWDYALGRFGFDVEVFDAQYFDQEPVIETRKIIQAINEELFIGDLLIERNRLLVLMFNFILSEQIAPVWLTKTSLIDVDHTVRNLLPFQIYRQDNQDFVLNYIQEVKPYHVQIREFNLIYQGLDTYQGTMTDFDVPAYWNASENLFVSPVLDDTGTLSTTSSTPSSSEIWQTLPWNQWYQNYLLSIEGATVIDGGQGYTVAPEVVVTGEAEEPAEMQAIVNSAGQVTAIQVINPGRGYLTTALIELIGGNGTGARAVANMGNGLVRDIRTTMKYDRYQYQSTVLPWQPGVSYVIGDQVRFDDRVWQATVNNNEQTFDLAQWELVDASTLSGVDRTMGFYVPRATEPGLDLALLISGVDYPGVQVAAPGFDQNTGFDVGNYDINPFDNISYGPEGLPTYDPAILDAIYESSFTDTYLGTRPTDINVDGGAFIDTYSSHAPEELVPGSMFDTLDFRVYTTPGEDYLGQGHGFDIQNVNYTYTGSGSYSFAGLVEYASTLRVWNRSIGTQLIEDVDYTVDWENQTIEIVSGITSGSVMVISVYGVGGGNQIYKNSYNGSAVGDTLIIPVEFGLINQIAIFVNGRQTLDFTSAAYETYSTEISFGETYDEEDYISVTVLGSASSGNTTSWSAPVTEYFVADGSLIYTLSNSMSGTNPANVIVEKNGIRARPAEGIEYLGNGIESTFDLPTNGGYSQGLIADNDVSVYVDNTPLILGVGYQVDAWDGSSDRTVTLTQAPMLGAKILISVRTAAQYTITGNQMIWKATGGFVPIIGDVITVTSWNDTAQQNIITQVFVGPESQGALLSQAYDSTDYDIGTVTNQPGSFDYATGTVIQTNRFDTGRAIPNASRIVVSVDGFYLFEDQGFTVDGTAVVIFGPPINANAVVAITSFTQNVVPAATAFRIFQDMRGLQQLYRITNDTTTELSQELLATDDVIYVVDASNLGQPNLAQGVFGLITINGERIAYRERNTLNNTLTGLRRGTAGTGAADHAVGSPVYDIGRGNLLPEEYQNRIVFENFLGDGSQDTFVATEISVTDIDSSEIVEAIEVYVGGIRQTSGYTVSAADPVEVVFDTAPDSGYQVTILVRRGHVMYEPGVSTPSDGVPLQEAQTEAARFIRGE